MLSTIDDAKFLAQNGEGRSDIFTFGCVLFEMLVGRRAFEGDTAAETMTAILREEPIDRATDAPPLPAGYLIGRSMGVSKDNRWITYTETGTEGDI